MDIVGVDASEEVCSQLRLECPVDAVKSCFVRGSHGSSRQVPFIFSLPTCPDHGKRSHFASCHISAGPGTELEVLEPHRPGWLPSGIEGRLQAATLPHLWQTSETSSRRAAMKTGHRSLIAAGRPLSCRGRATSTEPSPGAANPWSAKRSCKSVKATDSNTWQIPTHRWRRSWCGPFGVR